MMPSSPSAGSVTAAQAHTPSPPSSSSSHRLLSPEEESQLIQSQFEILARIEREQKERQRRQLLQQQQQQQLQQQQLIDEDLDWDENDTSSDYLQNQHHHLHHPGEEEESHYPVSHVIQQKQPNSPGLTGTTTITGDEDWISDGMSISEITTLTTASSKKSLANTTIPPSSSSMITAEKIRREQQKQLELLRIHQQEEEEKRAKQQSAAAAAAAAVKSSSPLEEQSTRSYSSSGNSQRSRVRSREQQYYHQVEADEDEEDQTTIFQLYQQLQQQQMQQHQQEQLQKQHSLPITTTTTYSDDGGGGKLSSHDKTQLLSHFHSADAIERILKSQKQIEQQATGRTHQENNPLDRSAAATMMTPTSSRRSLQSSTISSLDVSSPGYEHNNSTRSMLSSPRNPSEILQQQQQQQQQQDWNDAEAKRQVQFPGVAQALAERAANRSDIQQPQQQQQQQQQQTSQSSSSSRAGSSTVRNQHSEEDYENIVIERVPLNPLRRKSSSGRWSGNGSGSVSGGGGGGSNSESASNLYSTPSDTSLGGAAAAATTTTTMDAATTGGDYIVEGHNYVGAFYVLNVDDNGNPIVRSRPTSSTLQSQASEEEDQSTITHSTTSHFTNFTNEPAGSVSDVADSSTSRHRHRGGNRQFGDDDNDNDNYHTKNRVTFDCEEPPAPPLPATLVNTEIITAPVARVRITSAGSSTQVLQQQQQPQDNNDGNGDNRLGLILPGGAAAGYQKSTLTYIMGGLLCSVVVAGIFLALCYTVPAFAFVGLYDQDEYSTSQDSDDSSLFATIAPTGVEPTPLPFDMPTPAPTPMVLDLPNSTIQAIMDFPVITNSNNDVDPLLMRGGSPQARAYKWLVEDIAFQNRPTPRLYQRFALATLYYATNSWHDTFAGGSDITYLSWKRPVGWLDHELDECQWDTAGSDKGLPTPYRVCDPETGMFEALDLYANGLIGSIPPELSFLTTLKYLDLGRNDFSRTVQGIPTEIGLLTQMESFLLHFSYAEGSIPTEVGMWTNLKALELGKNRLIQNIPTELGLLTQLEVLDMPRNLLQGTLPTELSGLLARKLYHLDVESNRLSGSIPIEFNDALKARKDANGGILDAPTGQVFEALFRTNQFTGTVPSELCALQQRLKFDCVEDELCGCDCECPAP